MDLRQSQYPYPPPPPLQIKQVGRKEMFNLTTHSTYFISIFLHDIEEKERRKEMFYLTTHSAHFIYGYVASDIR